MLDALLRYSLDNRLSSFVFAVTLGVLGWFAFRDLTVGGQVRQRPGRKAT
jgi:hypothetical protein